jgi:hypothetical protein
MRGATVVSLVVLAASGLLTGCAEDADPDLLCESLPAQVLAAQSVPTASYVPCLEDIHSPWQVMSTDTDQDRSVVELVYGSEETEQTATVSLLSECSTPGGNAVQSTDRGVVTSSEIDGATYRLVYTFAGGCVEVSVVRFSDAKVSGLSAAEFTVDLVPRETLNDYVLDQTSGKVGLDPEEAS